VEDRNWTRIPPDAAAAEAGIGGGGGAEVADLAETRAGVGPEAGDGAGGSDALAGTRGDVLASANCIGLPTGGDAVAAWASGSSPGGGVAGRETPGGAVGARPAAATSSPRRAQIDSAIWAA
jgi:hypothetical protein